MCIHTEIVDPNFSEAPLRHQLHVSLAPEGRCGAMRPGTFRVPKALEGLGLEGLRSCLCTVFFFVGRQFQV